MHSPAKTGSGDAVTQSKNAELAYRVLDKHYEGKLDMGAWIKDGRWSRNLVLGRGIDIRKAERCGTIACVAGWACLLSGDRFMTHRNVQSADGTWYDVADRATDLLGLDLTEAGVLFYTISEDQLRVTIEKIFGPDPRMADSSARTDG
jgi:hypothetical protein